MTRQLFFLLIVLLLLTTVATVSVCAAGDPPQPKWSLKNPFEQKVFIENKGQYVLDKKHLALRQKQWEDYFLEKT